MARISLCLAWTGHRAFLHGCGACNDFVHFCDPISGRANVFEVDDCTAHSSGSRMVRRSLDKRQASDADLFSAERSVFLLRRRLVVLLPPAYGIHIFPDNLWVQDRSCACATFETLPCTLWPSHISRRCSDRQQHVLVANIQLWSWGVSLLLL